MMGQERSRSRGDPEFIPGRLPAVLVDVLGLVDLTHDTSVDDVDKAVFPAENALSRAAPEDHLSYAELVTHLQHEVSRDEGALGHQ